VDYWLLVKHSLPAIDPGRPAREWRLSAEGLRRCAPLAAALAEYAPDAVVSSVEPKARETGQAVAAALRLPLETFAGLHENDRMGLPYLPAADLEATVARFFAQPQEVVMGRETADEAHARFAAALGRVGQAYPSGTVVVVAHGTVISLLVARAAGLGAFDLWRRLGLPSFVALDRGSGALRAVVGSVEPGDS
jgi:broad specificity phosphatase PhoE